jgi:hypothetical protein
MLWSLPGYLQAQEDSLRLMPSDTIIPLKFPTDKLHSPHKATLYSAVLPGLGQAYNKKYWKIPIIYAGIGALGYAIHFNTTNYNKYKSAYRDFLIQDPANTSYDQIKLPPSITLEQIMANPTYRTWFQNALQNRKTYFKRYRDLSYIGMAALYVLNMIDASVDAHFYDYDISEDLSLQLQPTLTPNLYGESHVLGVQLKLKF